MDWRIADAKNRFSELVTLALTDGPQRVVRRDQSVVVVSQDEYDHLTGNRPGFKELLMAGPSFDGLELSRDAGEAMRGVKL